MEKCRRSVEMTEKKKQEKAELKGFCLRALELGAKAAKIIEADSIVTAPWVRVKCQFGCPAYGTRLS